MLTTLYRLFTSLKLTVVLLALGLIIVFWGTLAQVSLGLYKAQHDFFRSFFIYWSPPGVNWRLPIFPGGYLVGWLLLVNLFLAHFRYYQPGKRKIGIVLIHLGVVLLLVGQLLTDVFSTESLLHLREGQAKNYTEASRDFELAIIDTSESGTDRVVAISLRRLLQGGDVTHPDLPFTVRVREFYLNTSLQQQETPGHVPITLSGEQALGLWWRPLPHETEMDKRDMPSGIVELFTPNGSLGALLVSAYLPRPQMFVHDGRQYSVVFRLKRYYKPFTIRLLEFRHDRYPGTDIPKNFSSRVRLQRPETGEDREVLIYMNNPLRYEGETYYQASFDRDDQGTVLQVVRNPSWLTPYLACVIVSVGLLWQFFSHLFKFARKRSTT